MNNATTAKPPEADPRSALDEAMEAFLRHARDELGLSPATLDAYRRDLLQFCRWSRQQIADSAARIEAGQVRAFAAAEHRRGLHPRSIQRRLSALRRFFGYLRREGLLQTNPGQGVRPPRVRHRLPRPLDVDQVLALLNIPGNDRLAIRDRAMLELLYASGLRVSELAELRWDAIDAREGLVRVLGKGRKERVVPVGRHALEALQRWRETQASSTEAPSAVFTGHGEHRLSVRAIQKRVAHWSTRQGLDQRVHPHQLRHSFASHILESSGDLRAVQELLGHANLATTQVYTHLDFQHLARVYDQAHPRAHKNQPNRQPAAGTDKRDKPQPAD